jgi:N utilization substance protein B
MPADTGRKSSGRNRTASRVAAVQALFQGEQAQDNLETVIDQFVRHRLEGIPGADAAEEYAAGRIPAAEAGLFARIVREATREQDRIDALLATILPEDWPLARLDPVLRALLRAGGAELSMENGPPARVVINEYLDVAHGFFTGEEPRLANGVLNRMARTLRAAEFSEA